MPPSLRQTLGLTVLTTLASVSALAQGAPLFRSMATSRVLLVPAQEMSGAGDGRAWLARFDSLVTTRLEEGGIAAGWAYPKDAVHYFKQNPSYIGDPHMMGSQPLKNDKLKAGAAVPEPFGSRLRALIAIADARVSIVPVSATIDSATTPRSARLRLVMVDGRLSSVVWAGTVEAKYTGAASVAADSLAAAVARLFVNAEH